MPLMVSVTSPDDLISTGEAAEIARVTGETIRRWVAQGLVPCTRNPSGRLRFRRSDIEALIPEPAAESSAQ